MGFSNSKAKPKIIEDQQKDDDSEYSIQIEHYKREKEEEEEEGFFLGANEIELELILKQLRVAICKIILGENDVNHGTGFFCLIPFPDFYNQIPVLITNNHVLDENHLKSGNKIKFSLQNDKIFYEIKIDKSRVTYTNQKFDFTLIEIKESDNLNVNFLEIDKDIYSEFYEYKDLEVYLLHYPEKELSDASFGKIINISMDTYSIYHNCKSKSGSSGGPIIFLDNGLVIGIHCSRFKNLNYKSGLLIKSIIDDFNKSCKFKKIKFIQTVKLNEDERPKPKHAYAYASLKFKNDKESNTENKNNDNNNGENIDNNIDNNNEDNIDKDNNDDNIGNDNNNNNDNNDDNNDDNLENLDEDNENNYSEENFEEDIKNYESGESENDKNEKNDNNKIHILNNLEYLMKNSKNITHLIKRNIPVDENSNIKIEKNCINFTILSTKNKVQNNQNKDKVYCGCLKN